MGDARILVLATVIGVSDSHVLYPYCIQCYAKLLHDDHNKVWRCLRCDLSYEKASVPYRYRLSLAVADKSMISQITVFGRTLEPYFGEDATTFHRILSVAEKDVVNVQQRLQGCLEITFIGSSYWFGLKTSKVMRRQSELFRKSPVKLVSLLDFNRKDCSNIKGDGCNVIAYQMLSCNSVEKLPTVVDYLHEGVKTASIVNERRISDCAKSLNHLHNNRLGDLSADVTCSAKDSLMLEKSSMISSKSSFSFEQNTALFSCDETKLKVSDNSDTTTNSFCDTSSHLQTLHNVSNEIATDKPQHRDFSNVTSLIPQCAGIDSEPFQLSNCDFSSSFNDSSLLLACDRDGIPMIKQSCEITKNMSTEIQGALPVTKTMRVPLTECNNENYLNEVISLGNDNFDETIKCDFTDGSFTDIPDNISNKNGMHKSHIDSHKRICKSISKLKPKMSSYNNICEVSQHMPESEDMEKFFDGMSFSDDHNSDNYRNKKQWDRTEKLLSHTEIENDALWEHLPESEDFDDFLVNFDKKINHNQMSPIAEDMKTRCDNSTEISSSCVHNGDIKEDPLHSISKDKPVISKKTCTNDSLVVYFNNQLSNKCPPSSSIQFNEVTNRNINDDDEKVKKSSYEVNSDDANILFSETNESCVSEHIPALPQCDILTMEANEEQAGVQTCAKLITKDMEQYSCVSDSCCLKDYVSINSSSDLFDSYSSTSDILVGSDCAKECIDNTVDVVEESFIQNSNFMERFSTPLNAKSGSRKRKGVKFAQRLSIVSSIQVIDIRMKLNRSCVIDRCTNNLLPKPCLKRLSEVMDHLCESGSQDLFSPCPIVTFPTKVIILTPKDDECNGIVNSDTLPDVELLRDSEDLFSQNGYIPVVLSPLSCSSRISQEISLSSQNSFIIPPSTNKKKPQCILRSFSSYNPNIFKNKAEPFNNHVNSEMMCVSPDLFASSPDLFSPCTPYDIRTHESDVKRDKYSNINSNTSIFISTPNLYSQTSNHNLHSVIKCFSKEMKQSINKDRTSSNGEHSVLRQIYSVSPDIFSPLVDETPLCANKKHDVFICKKLFVEEVVSD